MDKQDVSRSIHPDSRGAPFFILLLPDIFAVAGNHTDALDQCVVQLSQLVHALAIPVQNLGMWQGFLFRVKYQQCPIFGVPAVVDVAEGFHQGDTGAFVGLVHAGVDGRHHSILPGPLFGGQTFAPRRRRGIQEPELKPIRVDL